MEFEDKLASLATKVKNQASAIGTEEATKNAFVMPFISTILGYDVFDPLEVVPEFTADVGVKRGEKIDYAIVRDGEVQILIECKPSLGLLKLEHASQLFRYFATTNARLAALTNGVVWQFYTDLDAPNRMDSKPFLVLDLLDIDDTLIPEIQKLSKDSFDLDSIISAAEELKYVGALKREIAAQFREPSDEWVKFFTTRVYEGSFTARVREQPAFNRSLQHRVVEASVAAPRTPRRVSSSRGPCVAGCSARERPLRGLPRTSVRGRCPSGSTVAATRWCSRSSAVARASGDQRRTPSCPSRARTGRGRRAPCRGPT